MTIEFVLPVRLKFWSSGGKRNRKRNLLNETVLRRIMMNYCDYGSNPVIYIVLRVIQ